VVSTPHQEQVVAIIDDDQGMRKAIARLLRAFGFLPETFTSGEEFLGAAQTSKAVCLIVDLHLGHSTGLDLVRQLSAKGLRFPVIFITGSDDDATRRQAVDLGCLTYLRKPFPSAALIEAIHNATGSTQRT
jgi:FixJ family two-component response regulator